MRALATAVVLLALLPAAAAAKTGISLNPPPDGLTAGEPWDVSFQYIHNDAQVDPPGGLKPSLTISNENGSQNLSFAAHHTYKGLWAARVVFPTAGRWEYWIQGFGKDVGPQSWDPVTITAAAKPAVVATDAGREGSSFPFGWAGGGAAVVLLAVGLIAVRHRS